MYTCINNIVKKIYFLKDNCHKNINKKEHAATLDVLNESQYIYNYHIIT